MEQTGSLLAVVTVGVGFFQRTQTSPLDQGTFAEPDSYARESEPVFESGGYAAGPGTPLR